MARDNQAQLSFTDLEFQQQGIQLDPELQTIADFLDQRQELIAHIRADLLRGLKHPDSGRDGLSPTQVLRCLVLMRIKNWDLRELRERIPMAMSCANSPISAVMNPYPNTTPSLAPLIV